MDSKLAPQPEVKEAQPENETPVSDPKPQDGRPQSYSMMDPKMRRIYGEFYRELYFSENKILDTKTQELISIAASLVAKCQGCLEGHIKKNNKMKVKAVLAEGQEISFDRALKMPTRTEAIGMVIALALSPARRLMAQVLAPASTIASTRSAASAGSSISAPGCPRGIRRPASV